MILLNNIYTIVITNFPNVNSATGDSNYEEGGIVTKWFTESFKKEVVEFFTWLLSSLLNILDPFITWGCSIIIVWCVISFYCTNDNRNLSLGMKSFLVYLIFAVIKGAVI